MTQSASPAPPIPYPRQTDPKLCPECIAWNEALVSLYAADLTPGASPIPETAINALEANVSAHREMHQTLSYALEMTPPRIVSQYERGGWGRGPAGPDGRPTWDVDDAEMWEPLSGVTERSKAFFMLNRRNFGQFVRAEVYDFEGAPMASADDPGRDYTVRLYDDAGRAMVLGGLVGGYGGEGPAGLYWLLREAGLADGEGRHPSEAAVYRLVRREREFCLWLDDAPQVGGVSPEGLAILGRVGPEGLAVAAGRRRRIREIAQSGALVGIKPEGAIHVTAAIPAEVDASAVVETIKALRPETYADLQDAYGADAQIVAHLIEDAAALAESMTAEEMDEMEREIARERAANDGAARITAPNGHVMASGPGFFVHYSPKTQAPNAPRRGAQEGR